MGFGCTKKRCLRHVQVPGRILRKDTSALKAYLKVLYLPFVLKQHEQAFVLYRMTIQAYKSASREQGVFFFLRDEQVSMCV